MRSRPDPVRAEVVNRRLELLRAELARDWQPAQAAADTETAAEVVSRGERVAGGTDAAWWSGHTRVAVPVPAEVLEATFEPPAPRAPAVPVPGRHAARRAAALIPAPLRGRIALGPWQLAVVALGVAVALAVACWWLVRASASAAPSPALVPASAAPLATMVPSARPVVPASTPPTVDTAPASGAAGTVTVDVEGKVRRPGIAVLPTGSRVIDAIHAAGGAPRRRDLGGLNLAAVLSDGQQIVVGQPHAGSVAGGSTAVMPSSGAAGPDAPVDLNTATADQLDALPGVGPVTAQAIIEWREQNGAFTSVDELLSVNGIGPATLAKIAPFVTV